MLTEKEYPKNNKKVNINASNHYAFRFSCKNGHFEIAKWLYQLSVDPLENNQKININADNDKAFRWSCNRGHIEIAKWLYQLSKDQNTWCCSAILSRAAAFHLRR